MINYYQNRIPVDLMTRYFRGIATVDELIELEAWKKVSPENRNSFEESKRMYERTGQAALHADVQINYDWFSGMESDEIRDIQTDVHVRKSTKEFLSLSFISTLGLFVLVAGVLFFFLFINQNRVRTAENTVEIEFPGGSSMVLGENSRLRYPASFLNKRKIFISGKADFKIITETHTPPIEILQDNIRIKAWDSEFSLTAKEGDILHIMVESGMIVLTTDHYGQKRDNLIYGGSNCILNKSNSEIKIYSADNIHNISGMAIPDRLSQ